MLFLGLEVMEMAISGEQSAALVNILADMFSVQFFKNPVVLIIIGTIFTFIIQASSAAIAIFMAFLIPSVTGGAAILTVDQAFFLTLGANIGTCSDGLMAAITANTDGKRIAIFHLLTSAIGAIFFSVVIAIFRTPINDLFNNIIVNPKWSLAIFNFSYNLIYTLLLLPLLTPLVKLVSSMVKEKPQKTPKVLEYLNPQILETPALAVIQVKREILSMGKRAANSLQIAYNAIISGDVSQSGVIEEQEEIIDRLNQEISDYLIKLSSLSISMSMEMAIGSYHHVINDIERIGDHAENCMSIALRLANSGEGFSEESAQELKAMHAKVSEALALGLAIFEKNDVRRLPEISAMERDIDAMHKEYSTIHYKRLNGNSNWAEIQIYYDLISELERIGDHVVNIAFSIVNPTGTESSVIPSAKPAKEIKR
jgi:phosphate:Na+ symporter